MRNVRIPFFALLAVICATTAFAQIKDIQWRIGPNIPEFRKGGCAAALGGKVKLRTLRGKVNLSIPPESSSGKLLRLKGPQFAVQRGRGLLIARTGAGQRSVLDCTAEHLFQFAVMGSELVTAVEGVAAPRVALLNIGQEEIKGNEQVKGAHELLSQSALNYAGYVEGDDIYLGDLDVIVTDGFVGNVALKSSEGVAKMIRHHLKAEFTRSLLRRLAGLIALPALKALSRKIDPRRYNGAALVGLRGIVVKSHGGADQLAFRNAIGIAKKEVHEDVPNRIAQRVETLLKVKESA